MGRKPKDVDEGADGVVIPPALAPRCSPRMGMLALADELPVMIAYFDRDLRYRFLNKALADWVELPRSEILGRTPAEITGEAALKERDAADRGGAGGRAAGGQHDLRPSDARGGGAAVRIYSVARRGRRGAGVHRGRDRRHRAARRREARCAKARRGSGGSPIRRR